MPVNNPGFSDFITTPVAVDGDDDQKPTHASIDGFLIDATVSEDHTFESEVTEYPVEQGSDVSDNIRNKPVTITMECTVSDTPMGDIADEPTRKTGSLPSAVAYNRMLVIRDAKTQVTLRTSLGFFDNMVLTSLGVPRKADTGNAITFTATFQQITFITNVRTTARVAIRTGGGLVKKGKAPTVPVGAKYVAVVTITELARKNNPFLNTELPRGTGVGHAPVTFTPIGTAIAGDEYFDAIQSRMVADGYIDAAGYHPFSSSNQDAPHYDRARGAFVTDKGQITQLVDDNGDPEDMFDHTGEDTSNFTGLHVNKAGL